MWSTLSLDHFFLMSQDAARTKNQSAYDKFVESAWRSARYCTLRGQLDLHFLDVSLPLSEVEDATLIVRRFCTGLYRGSATSSIISMSCDILWFMLG